MLKNLIIIFFFTAVTIFSQVEIDTKAPDFSLISSKGEKIALSDYSGKYVVLEWINFECPFVKKHYSTNNMQKLQKEFMDKDVVWLLVCSSADGKQGHFTYDEINSRIEELEINATAYLIDEDGKVGKQYGAKTTPHMFIINPEGNLIYAGAIDNKPSTKNEDVVGAENYIRSALNSVLEGKEIKTKTSVPYGCSVKY